MSSDLSDSPSPPAIHARPLPPPHPLDAHWRVRSGGTLYGPYTGHDIKAFLRDGRLVPESEVQLTEDGSWVALREDEVLGSLVPLPTASALALRTSAGALISPPVPRDADPRSSSRSIRPSRPPTLPSANTTPGRAIRCLREFSRSCSRVSGSSTMPAPARASR